MKEAFLGTPLFFVANSQRKAILSLTTKTQRHEGILYIKKLSVLVLYGKYRQIYGKYARIREEKCHCFRLLCLDTERLAGLLAGAEF